MSISKKTAATILEAASHVLALRGDAGSMTEVASAAGVGRSTLYRHFPTREALLEALTQVALTEAGDRLAEAKLESVPPLEALARAIRTIVVVGDRYVILLEAQVKIDPAATESAVVAPIRRVLERGQADGVIRTDIDAESLLELLGGLIIVSIRLAAERQTGVEETAATIQRVFIEGAGTR
ncbi:MAG: TetR family transcriptional regulator [Gaiellaceae bacterium]|jgi:AcrR family transcriptional regulator